MGLGMAYTTGKLKFVVGDYGAMVKILRWRDRSSGSFSAMGTVPRT